MWDLIVSVPDHCLSFYFSNWKDKVRFVKSLFSNRTNLNSVLISISTVLRFVLFENCLNVNCFVFFYVCLFFFCLFVFFFFFV